MLSARGVSIIPAISVAAMFAAADPSAAQNTAEKTLVGDTKVTMIQSYWRSDNLAKLPQVVIYRETLQWKP